MKSEDCSSLSAAGVVREKLLTLCRVGSGGRMLNEGWAVSGDGMAWELNKSISVGRRCKQSLFNLTLFFPAFLLPSRFHLIGSYPLALIFEVLILRIAVSKGRFWARFHSMVLSLMPRVLNNIDAVYQRLAEYL